MSKIPVIVSYVIIKPTRKNKFNQAIITFDGHHTDFIIEHKNLEICRWVAEKILVECTTDGSLRNLFIEFITISRTGGGVR